MAKVIQAVGALDGTSNLPTFKQELDVKAGAVGSIKAGYLVIKDAGNAGYVAAAADGTASTSVILGVALSDSTDTVAADGKVFIATSPTLVVKLFAKTPANLVATMKYDKFVLDVTSGNYTLDQGTTTNGIFRLMSFDNVTNGECYATLACNW